MAKRTDDGAKQNEKRKKDSFVSKEKVYFDIKSLTVMTSITFIVNYFHERTSERIKPETNRFLLWLLSPYSHSLVARCAMCSLLALNKQCYYNAWRVMLLESTNWTKTFCTVETSQRMFNAHSMTQPVQSINIQNLLTHF